MPLSRQTLARGLPWQEELLPFWWAQFAERMVLLVLPVVLLALWLMQRIPAYMRWALQSRVNRWYGKHAVYFAGMYGAEGQDPTRIAFTAVPDV